MQRYDVVTIGGGLAGAALAKGLAERGCSVLVVERETRFKDRVRGEQMHPWGVVELKALGLHDQVRLNCGHELPWFNTFVGPQQMAHRNLTETTPQQEPELAFYHPAMQEVVLGAAEEAGAAVRRGVRVTGVEPGSSPRVLLENDGHTTESIEARLVVGADGRSSQVRQWAGFEVKHDPPARLIAGVLFQDARVPDDSSHVVFNPGLGCVSALFPQRDGRLRAYLGYPSSEEARYSGEKDVDRFVEASIAVGAPTEYFRGATPSGPLASFDGADSWVPHPYSEGVVLIGDAAASNDPTYGEGLSLAVRDARVLRDRLLESDDWTSAGKAYAEQHDRYYSVIRQVARWFTSVFLEQGAEADARRMRAFPRFAEDPRRIPDHLFSGPELPFDDEVRRKFFAEDA